VPPAGPRSGEAGLAPGNATVAWMAATAGDDAAAGRLAVEKRRAVGGAAGGS
jgi:hypothetical protein